MAPEGKGNLKASEGPAGLFPDSGAMLTETLASVDAEAAPDSPHKGHRERLKARFLKVGADGLADHELLELLLFGGVPRRDNKPIAKAMIARFGSFEEAIAAPADQLLQFDHVGDGAVAIIKAVEAAAIRLTRQQVLKKPVLASWTALLDYCKSAVARAAEEQFRLLLLDRKNRLIEDVVMSEGTVDHTAVYPREIVKLAVAARASAVILVHNHPSGDPTPSRADIEMTRAIIAALKTIPIPVHDHLVIGRAGHASFRELGLL